MIGVMITASTKPEPASTSDVEAASTASEPAASDVERGAAQAASAALAAQLVRHAAARWLTSDEITRIGRQLARSIDQYERLHRQPPTWADALAGVDPVLLAPLQAVPDGWPNQPAHWRRELRQHLMTELRKTRWIVYNRTPRSLQPGDQGRGCLRTGGSTAVAHSPHGEGWTSSG
jgi:hypothetical protein